MAMPECRKYIGVFFPEIHGGFVPESYLDEPLEIVEKKVMMPWGMPFGADKVCLNYPVISLGKEDHEPRFEALTGGKEGLRDKLSVELHVDSTYPKTFVWACEDDELVPVSNAKRMGEALKQAKVPCKMRIYPTGGHGCSLAKRTSAEGWIDEMIEFMR